MHDNGMFVVAALIYSTIGLLIFVPVAIGLWLVQHFFARGLIRWLLLLIPHLIIKAAAWSLAYVAVRWFSTDDGRDLRWPLRWMMTKDADLFGDSYWQIECREKGIDPKSDAARIDWLRRNGGHTVNYGLLGVDVSGAWVDQYRDPRTGYITGGPLWTSDDAFELWLPIFGIDFMPDGICLATRTGGRNTGLRSADRSLSIRRRRPCRPQSSSSRSPSESCCFWRPTWSASRPRSPSRRSSPPRRRSRSRTGPS